MAERKYSEEEMSNLLKRAARLQAKAARHTDSRPGLTLKELETIAAEAGLDPMHLHQAAAELYEPDVASAHRKTSTNASHNFVDQWVAGELTDARWEEVVAELRHRYDSNLGQMMGGGELYGKGQISQVGRAKEWTHMSMSGIETRVIVQPRGESLQVKLSQRVGWGSTIAESITYGMSISLVIAVIAGGISDSGMIGALAMVASMLVSVPLISYADTAWRKKKHKELEELADRLAGILSDNTPRREPEMTYEDKEPAQIDASLLDQEDVYEEESKKQRGRVRE